MYLISIFFSYEQKIKYIFIYTLYKIIFSPTTDNERYKMRYTRVHQFLYEYVYTSICIHNLYIVSDEKIYIYICIHVCTCYVS